MKFDIKFDEFNANYMQDLDGYLPTYIGCDEEYSALGTIKLNIEMIARTHMMDGPSRFFRVLCIEVTPEQYELVKSYAAAAGDQWKLELTSDANETVEYSNNFVYKQDEDEEE